MPATKKLNNKKGNKQLEAINQGDCISLVDKKDLFQVIGIDNKHKRCWVRKWPLHPHGSPVFEISIKQISPSS